MRGRLLTRMMGARVLTVLCACLVCPAALRAQDQPEYRMEIGAGAGLMAYQGDFSGSLVRQMQPLAGLQVKYKLNPRMAWAAWLGYGNLKGSSDNAETWYPELADTPMDFKSKLVDFEVRYEYNFWAFGTGREYHGARPFTPFITLGAGLAFADAGKSVAAFQLPIGLGVKLKLRDRLNLAAEWTMHFTGSDRLDGVKDPYGIKSSGWMKNTDSFSAFRLTLTYEFLEKCKTCHNDKD